jgi:hypothetical protein
VARPIASAVTTATAVKMIAVALVIANAAPSAPVAKRTPGARKVVTNQRERRASQVNLHRRIYYIINSFH